MEKEIEVVREQIEQEIPIEQEDIYLNIGGTQNYNELNNKPQINSVTLQGNKTSSNLGLQDTLVSGTNIKTINNQPVLGSGDLKGGYPEVPAKLYEYTNLLELLNDDVNIPDGIYTVSQEWHCDIPKANDEWASDNINPNSILYIYRNYGVISWTGTTASIYWSNGDETFTGGYLTNSEDVETLIDEKLGSNVVMADTEQTITGKKTFTSNNGTVFENAGGLILKYLSSSPEFKIIPDNNGNFDFYYHDTLLGRIDSNNTILYRGLIPYLTEQVDLGSSTYKFNNIYVKTLYGNNVPKEVSKLITNDSNIIPETGGILTLGNSTYRWNSLYLGTNINFNPQQVTRIENLKTLSVNTIKLGQQQGSTTTWMDSDFLQLNSGDIKCVGKLLGGLNVNNMAIHNIPDTPDDGTSPINKNYADTNLQGKLTFDSTPTASSTNPVTSGGVFNSIQNIIEVAEGKTASYTLSYATTGNEAFNTQNDSVTVTSFIDSAGNTITDEDVKIGDIVLILEVGVPDRWVQSIDTENHTITFYKMETAKIDLNNYVDLSSAQTITGLKTNLSPLKVSKANLNYAWFMSPSSWDTLTFGLGAKASSSASNNYYYMNTSSFSPRQGATTNLGASNSKWNNLYLSGNLSDGTNEVAVADIADKTYVDTKIGDIDTVLTRLVSGEGV